MKGITYYELELNKKLKFLVFNSPTDQTVDQLNQIIDKHEMKLIFRLCDPIYDTAKIVNSTVIDILIDDGDFPSSINISDTIKYIDAYMAETDKQLCIGLHCKSGLGRSPVLTAILMMYYDNKTYDDYVKVVKVIRDTIPGSINRIQLLGLSMLDINKIRKQLTSDNKSKQICSIS